MWVYLRHFLPALALAPATAGVLCWYTVCTLPPKGGMCASLPNIACREGPIARYDCDTGDIHMVDDNSTDVHPVDAPQRVPGYETGQRTCKQARQCLMSEVLRHWYEFRTDVDEGISMDGVTDVARARMRRHQRRGQRDGRCWIFRITARTLSES